MTAEEAFEVDRNAAITLVMLADPELRPRYYAAFLAWGRGKDRSTRRLNEMLDAAAKGEKDMADQPKSRRIWPVELFWQIKEAAQSVEPDAHVIFRSVGGVERPVAKVKIRGFNTIILCEGIDD